MTDIMTAEEFTECFTERIREFALSPSWAEPLLVELHYGEQEPVLKLSLRDLYARYQSSPSELDELFQPFIRDLGWSVQKPRPAATDIFAQTLPVMRNFIASIPSEAEIDFDPACPKGPIVYQELLRSPAEYIVAQFHLRADGTLKPLRRGEVLNCSPDPASLAQIAFGNLASVVDEHGLTASPLRFDNLKMQAYVVSLPDESYAQHTAALTCIPPVMASLEESLSASGGLLAIIPSPDQLIVATDPSPTTLVELGVLAAQLKERSPDPLSCFIWGFKDGGLDAVQAIELEETADGS